MMLSNKDYTKIISLWRKIYKLIAVRFFWGEISKELAFSKVKTYIRQMGPFHKKLHATLSNCTSIAKQREIIQLLNLCHESYALADYSQLDKVDFIKQFWGVDLKKLKPLAHEKTVCFLDNLGKLSSLIGAERDALIHKILRPRFSKSELFDEIKKSLKGTIGRYLNSKPFGKYLNLVHLIEYKFSDCMTISFDIRKGHQKIYIPRKDAYCDFVAKCIIPAHEIVGHFLFENSLSANKNKLFHIHRNGLATRTDEGFIADYHIYQLSKAEFATSIEKCYFTFRLVEISAMCFGEIMYFLDNETEKALLDFFISIGYPKHYAKRSTQIICNDIPGSRCPYLAGLNERLDLERKIPPEEIDNLLYFSIGCITPEMIYEELRCRS